VLQAYEKVSPRINEFIDKASPYVKSTVDEVNKIALPAAKEFTSKAAPVVTVCPISCVLGTLLRNAGYCFAVWPPAVLGGCL
jgi:hypothetical protein